VALVAAAGAAALLALTAGRAPSERAGQHRLRALEQTVLPVTGGEPLRLPALVAADGTVFPPERFRGRWSVIFFGFTSCPDVCPTTLRVLDAVARDAGSGVSVGTTRIVFVSVDPDRDTPGRLQSYLEVFGGGILGLTGSRDAVDRFSAEVGAAARPFGAGIDHSTSLFVLDPRGGLAGILLHPGDPARIVADLAALRSGSVDATAARLAP
jgi:protein SCO1/2